MIAQKQSFVLSLDGYAKTFIGVSLNQLLMAGPAVQSSLSSLLISFPLHKIEIDEDVKKMYRQVLVDKTDTNYQIILWCDCASEYRLLTVYGLASLSLAIRALIEIANNNTPRSFKKGLMTGGDNKIE